MREYHNQRSRPCRARVQFPYIQPKNFLPRDNYILPRACHHGYPRPNLALRLVEFTGAGDV
jgi:hypothetical protein